MGLCEKLSKRGTLERRRDKGVEGGQKRRPACFLLRFDESEAVAEGGESKVVVEKY